MSLNKDIMPIVEFSRYISALVEKKEEEICRAKSLQELNQINIKIGPFFLDGNSDLTQEEQQKIKDAEAVLRELKEWIRDRFMRANIKRLKESICNTSSLEELESLWNSLKTTLSDKGFSKEEAKQAIADLKGEYLRRRHQFFIRWQIMGFPASSTI